MGGLSVSCRWPFTESRCQCQEVSFSFLEEGHVPPGSGMTTKIIHFMVNGKLEQAEFGADCSAADVKGKREGLQLVATADFRDIIIM